MITVIDYGAGNLRSIVNACKFLDYDVNLAETPDAMDNAKKIILPGVGNFGDAMKSLSPFKKIIYEKIESNIPFLGICLGIQVIMDESEESPGSKGIGLFEGKCKKFRGVKVPHIGWNNIKIKKSDIPILKDINEDYFYFVHSYYPEVEDNDLIAAVTDYGVTFPSVIARDNVFACQFHPEKSGESGLKLLKNFLEYSGI